MEAFKWFMFLFALAIIILLGVIYHQMTQKCDVYNIAIGREAKDHTVDVQYVRICKDDLSSLADIIESTNQKLSYE